MGSKGKSIKRVAKTTGLILLVIVVLCVTISITPTLGQQIPFNEWIWKHHPIHKIRYFMSDDLVNKLNTEKPNIEQVADMLGQDLSDRPIHVGDKWLSYLLRTPPFLLIGLDMYTLDICFDEEGSFLSASVVFSD